MAAPGLAELHAHLYGSVPPEAVLCHLAEDYDRVQWEWYEEFYEATVGTRPPTRDLVARFRGGDRSVIPAFRDVYVPGAGHAGDVARFSAGGRLPWASEDGAPGRRDEVALRYLAAVRSQLAAEGVAYAELRCQPSSVLPAAFAEPQAGPVLRMAVSLDRDDPWPGWEQVQEIVLGPHGPAVTGIDFCGIEEGHPPQDMAGFFAAVHEFNDAH